MIDKFKDFLRTRYSDAALQRKGYHCQIVYVEERLLAAAKFAIAESERAGTFHSGASGLWKREQAMRMLTNIVPQASEHDRALAVEVAIEIIRNA